MTATIAQPMTLKNGRQIKNRLFKSAMSEQLGLPNRDPGDALVNLYQQWADGGCGLLVSGNIMVDRQHLGEPRNVVLDEESDLAAFTKWASAGSSNNTEFWAQLNHPGKQSPAFVNPQPLAPSAIALGLGLEKVFRTPKAMTEEEIQYAIGRYANAAVLAKKVGFNGVQIHGAHGYLVSQFLSARHNQRDDQWGGSLENRMRFALSVYQAIREKVGDDYPVAIKLNSADFMDGAFTEEDSMQVVQALTAAGMDLIEISGGTYESPEMAQETPNEPVKASTKKREAFFMDYAEKVRALVDIPLVVTGGFRSTKGMNDALATGALDMIGIARPMAIDPNVPNLALASDDYAVALPHLSTGIKAVDKMAAHNIYWYEYQLWRLGKGRAPNPTLSPWRSFFATMALNGKAMWAQRRA